MARTSSVRECLVIRQGLRRPVLLVRRPLIHVAEKDERVATPLPLLNTACLFFT